MLIKLDGSKTLLAEYFRLHEYIENYLIPNCPITKEDIIMRAEDILGPNLGSLKGKMTLRTPERITLNTLGNMPNGMLRKHGDVTIAVNIMYINDIPLMMTMSQAIHFGTVVMIKNKTKSMIIKSIQQIINTYQGRGFRIKHILGDRQFEFIRKHMVRKDINVNITGRDEHIPEIERYIRTVKDTLRYIASPNHRQNGLQCSFWLNCFPHKDGIHPTHSPCMIITGSKINLNKHCKLQFGHMYKSTSNPTIQ
jgi:hypothetical protein